MKTIIPLAITIAVCVAGCGSAAVPADKLARSQAMITSAEELNAQRVPQAALYLRMAQDEMNQAKQFLKEGENDKATPLLLRAEADGQASLSLAREAAAQAEAQKTIDSVQELKKQMGQSSNSSMPTPMPLVQPTPQGVTR